MQGLQHYSSTIASCLTVIDDLNRTLSRFWDIDHVSSPETSPEEQACEYFF